MRNRSRKGTGRAAAALVAALAAGAVATPLAIAAASAEPAPVAADGGPNDLMLPTPEVPRISNSAYAGFQVCGSPEGDPLVTSGSPTLAATLESVAPPGTVETTEPGPRRKIVFEVDTAGGAQVVRKQLTSDTSHEAAYQLPEGKLTDGDYRWRMRVKDGGTVSEWTAWCTFKVRRG
ncbi:hypothetical protein ACFUJR_16660 [Streptomyces sp. NPDC057271]|uniref:hypothetical protein n=1 Tax=unclassified Streptomyces TaxID=2593676 RepID=UPI00362E81AA